VSAGPIDVIEPGATWRRQLGRVPGGVGFGVVIALVLGTAVVVGPWLPWLPSPIEVNPTAALESPSLAHPMGTDHLGRDLLSRFLHGGRVSLAIALGAVALGGTFGTLLGLLAGFFGGRLDVTISWLVEVLLAFPGVLLALAIITMLGAGPTNVAIAVGIAFVPSFTRVVRASVLSVRERTFVEAAAAIGNPPMVVLLAHVLPNATRSVQVIATIGMGTAILDAAALSFLGLGTQPPSPEWGAMLSSGAGMLRSGWWLTVFPGLGIFLAVLSVNLIGEGLMDRSPGR